MLLYDRQIHGASNPRLKVHLNKRDDGGRQIQKCYPKKKALDLIVGGFDEVATIQHRLLPLSHLPLGSAKTSLAVAYRLDDCATKATRMVAAALVQIVFEHGIFQAHKGQHHLRVPFKDICQDRSILNYHIVTKAFGWQIDTANVKTVPQKIVIAYRNWIIQAEQNDNLHAVVKDTHSMRGLLLQIENQFLEDNGYPMIAENKLDHMDIIAPIIHIAAEALYSSIFEKLPSYRPYRPLTTYTLRRNAEVLWLLIGPTTSSTKNSFQLFREEAIMSVLPGSPVLNAQDLAVVSNGLVAYSAQLGQLQTLKRLSTAISVVEGYLRWGRDQGAFHRLHEINGLAFSSNRSIYESTRKLEVF